MQLKKTTYSLLILLSLLLVSTDCFLPEALCQTSRVEASLLLPLKIPTAIPTNSPEPLFNQSRSVIAHLNPGNFFQAASEPTTHQLLPLVEPLINSKFDPEPKKNSNFGSANEPPSTPSASLIRPKSIADVNNKKAFVQPNQPLGPLKPLHSLWAITPITRKPSPLIEDPELTITSFHESVQQPSQAQNATQNNKTQEATPVPLGNGDPPQLISAELSLSDLAQHTQKQIDLITSDDTLDKATKQEQLIQLNLANQIVKEAQVIQEEIAKEKQRREMFPRDLKELQEQLSLESAPNSPNSDRTSKQIETELRQKKQQRDELKSKQVLVDDEIEELATQIATNPILKTELLKESKETEEKYLESRSTSNSDNSRLIFNAEKLKSNKQLEKIGLETIKQDQLGILLPIKKAIVEHDIKKIDFEIKLWQTTFSQQQNLEILLQQEQAKQASIQAIQTDKSLEKIANENQKITQTRSNIARDIEQCSEKFTAADREYEEITTDLESIKDKIEMPGGNRQNRGIELVKLSRNLMHTFESQSRIDSINVELRNCQLNELNLKAKLRVLTKRDAEINRLTSERLASGASAGNSLPSSDFTNLASELLEKQLKYSSDLLLDYQKLRTCLVYERERLIQLINKVNEAREYSAKNALWVRSAAPFSFSDFKSSWRAIQLLFSPKQWIELSKNVSSNIQKRPYGTLFACFLILCAFIFSWRLRGDA